MSSFWQNPSEIFSEKMTRRVFFGAVAGGVAWWALRRFGVDSQTVSAAGTVTIVEFAANGTKTGKVTVARVVKPDAEWKRQLSPASYEVTRHSATERAFTGSTWNLHDKGIYRCICCDTALFSSETKFESGTGWPSFWRPIAKENVEEKGDFALGVERDAVACRRCDAHLGHVFPDGPPPTGLRYCMNSAAMRFVKLA